MREILTEFKESKPRAVVLDDSANSRQAIKRDLELENFEVAACENEQSFASVWSPGMFDVVIADWDLSAHDKGHQVLKMVREKDWDVPFILVSGQLNDGEERSSVFETMLELGNSDFVERGDDSNAEICRKCFLMIAKRDLALLRLVLKFRKGALQGINVKTTSGTVTGRKLLEELVKDPTSSHDSEGPLADRIASRISGD